VIVLFCANYRKVVCVVLLQEHLNNVLSCKFQDVFMSPITRRFCRKTFAYNKKALAQDSKCVAPYVSFLCIQFLLSLWYILRNFCAIDMLLTTSLLCLLFHERSFLNNFSQFITVHYFAGSKTIAVGFVPILWHPDAVKQRFNCCIS
jgi:hypothetical protein